MYIVYTYIKVKTKKKSKISESKNIFIYYIQTHTIFDSFYLFSTQCTFVVGCAMRCWCKKKMVSMYFIVIKKIFFKSKSNAGVVLLFLFSFSSIFLLTKEK